MRNYLFYIQIRLNATDLYINNDQPFKFYMVLGFEKENAFAYICIGDKLPGLIECMYQDKSNCENL